MHIVKLSYHAIAAVGVKTVTTFTIAVSITCDLWELDLETRCIQGYWIGVFAQKGKLYKTITAKNRF